MSQYHDTVREELEDILGVIQKSHRENNPDNVVLYRAGNQSLTSEDVARAISRLASQPIKQAKYSVYGHNFYDANSVVGYLEIEARTGRIDVGYTANGEPDAKFRFRMLIGFGSRVSSYEIQDSHDQYLAHFSKDMVRANLEQTLMNVR